MGSKQLGLKFLYRSQICSHTPSALNAGAKRSGATCHMAMPQCCYLAKGAKRPSHTTNTIKFDRNPFDPCNSIKRFDLSPSDQKNSTYLQPPSCEFEALFNEAKALQLRIPKVRKTQNPGEMKSFDIQMSSGKISNALRCLDESQKGNVLSLQERVGKNRNANPSGEIPKTDDIKRQLRH